MNPRHLLCPLCGDSLALQGRSLCCQNRHSFDLAKEGYANLLPVNAKHAKNPGDSREMLLSRRDFLAEGFYAPFAHQLAALCPAPAAGSPLRILDAGCGEGYYGRTLLDDLAARDVEAEMIGYDIAKEGVRLAAKADKRPTYLVASSNRIPVKDGWADVILNIFSPMAREEFLRVLRPGGLLIYAVPTPNHLMGLKQVLYPAPYPNRVQEIAYEGFAELSRTEITDTVTLNHTQLMNLFAMTPYYWKTPKEGSERLQALSTLTTEIGFAFVVYQKNN